MAPLTARSLPAGEAPAAAKLATLSLKGALTALASSMTHWISLRGHAAPSRRPIVEPQSTFRPVGWESKGPHEGVLLEMAPSMPSPSRIRRTRKICQQLLARGDPRLRRAWARIAKEGVGRLEMNRRKIVFFSEGNRGAISRRTIRSVRAEQAFARPARQVSGCERGYKINSQPPSPQSQSPSYLRLNRAADGTLPGCAAEPGNDPQRTSLGR
jgi:hypothetical protein